MKLEETEQKQRRKKRSRPRTRELWIWFPELPKKYFSRSFVRKGKQRQGLLVNYFKGNVGFTDDTIRSLIWALSGSWTGVTKAALSKRDIIKLSEKKKRVTYCKGRCW